MTTANDIIAGALRLISSVTPGEAIPGDEAGNALIVLNDMIGSWSAESNMPPWKTTETFALTQGQESYQIGTSGSPDFNTARPDEIVDCYCTDTGSGTPFDYDMEFMTKEQYDAVGLKSVNGIPHWLYYDPQYPNGNIYIYETAGTTTFTLTIVSLKPVAQFSALTSALSMPPEYNHAMKVLLADLLAFEYGYDIPQRLAGEIERCRSMIKSKNAKRVTAGFDPIFRRKRTFSILTG